MSEILMLISIISWTIACISFGYALGRDSAKSK